MQLVNKDIVFNSKPTAVPYNYRISYKVSLVCLIIGKCCGKKGCSSIKLQMINAAICSSAKKRELLLLASHQLGKEIALVRFDPSISRAICYAIADELIYQQGNGLFRLKEKGKLLVACIYSDSSVMSVEKEFFEELSSLLTEEIIDEIEESWRE